MCLHVLIRGRPHGSAHWRHLVNTIELSICSGDAALCRITLTTSCELQVVVITLLDEGYSWTKLCRVPLQHIHDIVYSSHNEDGDNECYHWK